MTIDHGLAATIAERALGAVFEAQAVAALREDSPLSALGLQPADLVALSDAVAAHAAAAGWVCHLGDEAWQDVDAVAGLIAAIELVSVPTGTIEASA